MITAELAQQFAEEWIAAWNSHDLERIFSHYSDDFEMSSPYIVERMGVASGTLRGKDAIRPYWAWGLAALGDLHFELEAVYAGVGSIAITYLRNDGRRVAEVLFFGPDGRAIRGVAHYST